MVAWFFLHTKNLHISIYAGISYDPPYCYFEGGSLKFNYGTNYGSCTSYDKCLCKASSTSVVFTGIKQYEVMTSAAATVMCSRVTSLTECNTAAYQLNVSDQTAISDSCISSQNCTSSSPSGGVLNLTRSEYEKSQPPFCYFEGGSLKFNVANNTGACTETKKCLCRLKTFRSNATTCSSCSVCDPKLKQV